eukprot:jgi/Mesvir1/1042/Mv17566-RA.1
MVSKVFRWLGRSHRKESRLLADAQVPDTGASFGRPPSSPPPGTADPRRAGVLELQAPEAAEPSDDYIPPPGRTPSREDSPAGDAPPSGPPSYLVSGARVEPHVAATHAWGANCASQVKHTLSSLDPDHRLDAKCRDKLEGILLQCYLQRMDYMGQAQQVADLTDEIGRLRLQLGGAREGWAAEVCALHTMHEADVAAQKQERLRAGRALYDMERRMEGNERLVGDVCQQNVALRAANASLRRQLQEYASGAMVTCERAPGGTAAGDGGGNDQRGRVSIMDGVNSGPGQHRDVDNDLIPQHGEDHLGPSGRPDQDEPAVPAAAHSCLHARASVGRVTAAAHARRGDEPPPPPQSEEAVVRCLSHHLHRRRPHLFHGHSDGHPLFGGHHGSPPHAATTTIVALPLRSADGARSPGQPAESAPGVVLRLPAPGLALPPGVGLPDVGGASGSPEGGCPRHPLGFPLAVTAAGSAAAITVPTPTAPSSHLGHLQGTDGCPLASVTDAPLACQVASSLLLAALTEASRAGERYVATAMELLAPGGGREGEQGGGVDRGTVAGGTFPGPDDEARWAERGRVLGGREAGMKGRHLGGRLGRDKPRERHDPCDQGPCEVSDGQGGAQGPAIPCRQRLMGLLASVAFAFFESEGFAPRGSARTPATRQVSAERHRAAHAAIRDRDGDPCECPAWVAGKGQGVGKGADDTGPAASADARKSHDAGASSQRADTCPFHVWAENLCARFEVALARAAIGMPNNSNMTRVAASRLAGPGALASPLAGGPVAMAGLPPAPCMGTGADYPGVGVPAARPHAAASPTSPSKETVAGPVDALPPSDPPGMDVALSDSVAFAVAALPGDHHGPSERPGELGCLLGAPLPERSRRLLVDGHRRTLLLAFAAKVWTLRSLARSFDDDPECAVELIWRRWGQAADPLTCCVDGVDSDPGIAGGDLGGGAAGDAWEGTGDGVGTLPDVPVASPALAQLPPHRYPPPPPRRGDALVSTVTAGSDGDGTVTCARSPSGDKGTGAAISHIGDPGETPMLPSSSPSKSSAEATREQEHPRVAATAQAPAIAVASTSDASAGDAAPRVVAFTTLPGFLVGGAHLAAPCRVVLQATASGVGWIRQGNVSRPIPPVNRELLPPGATTAGGLPPPVLSLDAVPLPAVQTHGAPSPSVANIAVLQAPVVGNGGRPSRDQAAPTLALGGGCEDLPGDTCRDRGLGRARPQLSLELLNRHNDRHEHALHDHHDYVCNDGHDYGPKGHYGGGEDLYDGYQTHRQFFIGQYIHGHDGGGDSDGDGDGDDDDDDGGAGGSRAHPPWTADLGSVLVIASPAATAGSEGDQWAHLADSFDHTAAARHAQAGMLHHGPGGPGFCAPHGVLGAAPHGLWRTAAHVPAERWLLLPPHPRNALASATAAVGGGSGGSGDQGDNGDAAAAVGGAGGGGDAAAAVGGGAGDIRGGGGAIGAANAGAALPSDALCAGTGGVARRLTYAPAVFSREQLSVEREHRQRHGQGQEQERERGRQQEEDRRHGPLSHRGMGEGAQGAEEVPAASSHDAALGNAGMRNGATPSHAVRGAMPGHGVGYAGGHVSPWVGQRGPGAAMMDSVSSHDLPQRGAVSGVGPGSHGRNFGHAQGEAGWTGERVGSWRASVGHPVMDASISPHAVTPSNSHSPLGDESGGHEGDVGGLSGGGWLYEGDSSSDAATLSHSSASHPGGVYPGNPQNGSGDYSCVDDPGPAGGSGNELFSPRGQQRQRRGGDADASIAGLQRGPYATTPSNASIDIQRDQLSAGGNEGSYASVNDTCKSSLRPGPGRYDMVMTTDASMSTMQDGAYVAATDENNSSSPATQGGAYPGMLDASWLVAVTSEGSGGSGFGDASSVGVSENDNDRGTSENDNDRGMSENDNERGTSESDNERGASENDNDRGTSEKDRGLSAGSIESDNGGEPAYENAWGSQGGDASQVAPNMPKGGMREIGVRRGMGSNGTAAATQRAETVVAEVGGGGEPLQQAGQRGGTRQLAHIKTATVMVGPGAVREPRGIDLRMFRKS